MIAAYESLLYWHLQWYHEDCIEKHAKGRMPKVYQGRGGAWRLTTAERKRILTNSIFGVDVDPHAVEVTKLSLLLKVLEGESSDRLESQLRLFRQRALPDLGNNIRCGNALVGTDFYGGRQDLLFDAEESFRINAFDWHAEFPRAIGDGGFSAVIGNPPVPVPSQADRRFDWKTVYVSTTTGTIRALVGKPVTVSLLQRRMR